MNVAKASRLVGFAGSAMGLLAGIALASIRIGWINVNPGTEPRPGPSVELPGNLGFLFACTMPFILALVALRFRNPSWRAAIWLGIAILALVVAFSPISIATFLLLPLPALLLAFAAILTLGETRAGEHLRVLVLAAGVAIMVGLGAVVLFSLPDASCWMLMRSSSGQEVWQPVPYTNTITVGPGTGISAGSCASDIISPLEAIMSVGMWAITLVGLALVLPRALPREAEK